jgi:hypothetical protein
MDIDTINIEKTNIKETTTNEWDIYSILTYIKDHTIKILLFAAVFVIIFAVDHISNFNAKLLALQTSMPGLDTSSSPIKQIKKLIKTTKKQKNIKK